MQKRPNVFRRESGVQAIQTGSGALVRRIRDLAMVDTRHGSVSLMPRSFSYRVTDRRKAYGDTARINRLA